MVEIENFSDKSLAKNAATQLVDPNKYNATFFFGPISSGLLNSVANVTEPNKKILMSSRSNFPTVWTGVFDFTFGMLYHWPPKNPFLDTFKLYADKGAKKIGIICDSTEYFPGFNYCMHVEKVTFDAEIQPYGMTVEQNISVSSGLDSTYNNLREAIRIMSQSNIDILVISAGIADYYPPVVTVPSYIKDIVYFMKDFKVQYSINSFLKIIFT
jgi:hypothetical protein